MEGAEISSTLYPEPLRKIGGEGETLLVYEGLVHITVRLRLAKGGKKRPALKAMIRFQPCHGTTCHKVEDVSILIPA